MIARFMRQLFSQQRTYQWDSVSRIYCIIINLVQLFPYQHIQSLHQKNEKLSTFQNINFWLNIHTDKNDITERHVH